MKVVVNTSARAMISSVSHTTCSMDTSLQHVTTLCAVGSLLATIGRREEGERGKIRFYELESEYMMKPRCAVAVFTLRASVFEHAHSVNMKCCGAVEFRISCSLFGFFFDVFSDF